MEKKLPGIVQSFLDIPLALKGFPKNLGAKPKNVKEITHYKREHGGYVWLCVLVMLAGVLLSGIFIDNENLMGVGMLVAMVGFGFLIFLLYKMNQIKNSVGVQIADLTCSGCQEMISYDENVQYKVLGSSWRVRSHKMPTKRGEEAATSPHEVIAEGEEKTSVEISCKCQSCGKVHSFTKVFCTGRCQKVMYRVLASQADKVRVALEQDVYQVCDEVFEKKGSGKNALGVSVSRYDVAASVKGHFEV